MKHTTSVKLVRMRKDITKIAPLLHVDKHDKWTVRDLEADGNQVQSALKLCRKAGGIDKVGTKMVSRPDTTTNKQVERCVYRWKPSVYQKLKDYYEERDCLPCGHRAHLYNSPEVDGYSCKFCIEEGKIPEFDKETVKEVL